MWRNKEYATSRLVENKLQKTQSKGPLLMKVKCKCQYYNQRTDSASQKQESTHTKPNTNLKMFVGTVNFQVYIVRTLSL